MTRRLRITFERPEAFRLEFDRNIAKGGAFVPGVGGVELREVVEVEVVLGFAGERRSLAAEVVHVAAGAGVAVQFLRPAADVRDEFAALLSRTRKEPEWELPALDELGGSLAEADLSDLDGDLFGPTSAAPAAKPAAGIERRRSPRAPARVPALLDGTRGRIQGVTRNLSETGALISADATELPPGKTVRLQLRHPETGDPLEVSGRVTRHVETAGTVAAVSVNFDVPTDQKPDLAALVRAAEQAHQQRAAGGISGRIEELGMPNLIQMLGRSSPHGTLSATTGAEEGVLAFEGGNLRYARLGATRGIKALARMLQWTAGSFEFHAHVDPLDVEDEPMRLEAAPGGAAHITTDEAVMSRGKIVFADTCAVCHSSKQPARTSRCGSRPRCSRPRAGSTRRFAPGHRVSTRRRASTSIALRSLRPARSRRWRKPCSTSRPPASPSGASSTWFRRTTLRCRRRCSR